MNYNGLTASYWNSQVERIYGLLNKINSRGEALTAGRVIPQDTDLVLGTGRYLKTAVMFLDISGFSIRPMETKQEQSMMLSALNLFFTEMIRITEDYGGVVEKNTGDGLMAYFSDNGDVYQENSSKRAVSCALTMLATNKFIISKIFTSSGMVPFDFRVSIDYGLVTIANLGSARRFNSYVAIGTTANLAAKIINKITAGEIIIGEAAKNLLPIDWQQKYVLILPDASGWTYGKSGKNYNLYKYVGRWNQLIGETK
jgi:adenylate cyclase